MMIFKKIQKRVIKKSIGLIDYLVIFLVVSFVGISLVYFPRQKDKVYVDFLVTGEGLKEDVYQTSSFIWNSSSIKDGMIVRNLSGSKMGEVVDIAVYNYGNNRRFPKVKLKIDVLFDKTTGIYKIGDTSLLIGSLHTFDLGGTRYKGVVTYYGTSPNDINIKEKQVSILLKVSNIDPELANYYNSDFVVKRQDKEIFSLTKSNIVNSDTQITLQKMTSSVALDKTLLKDVYIEASILVECLDDNCFFENTVPVKVGGYFWIEDNELIIERGSARILKVVELGDINH